MKNTKLVAKAVSALLMAALVVTGGNTTLTAHAQVVNDGCVRGSGSVGDRPSEARESSFTSGSESSSSSSSASSSTSYSGSSSSSSSSSSGSSSYSAASYDAGSSNSGSYDAGSGDSGSGDATASTPAPTGLSAKGNVLSVAGGQEYRQVNDAAAGRVSVYHMGVERYTLQLYDAKGNAVAYQSAAPYQDTTTGLWYLNVVTEGDAKGYTVGTYKGSVNYLPTLNLQGVMLNQKVVVTATAE